MTVNYIYGVLHFEEGPDLYVKDYYSNAYVLRFHLTDDITKTELFSGDKHSGNPNSDNDVYFKSPNYNPLATVSYLFRIAEDLSWYSYKGMDIVKIKKDNPLEGIIEKTSADKTWGFVAHTNIDKKRIEITDERNGNTIEFILENDYNKKKKKALKAQLDLTSHLGVLYLLPESCRGPLDDYGECMDVLSSCKYLLRCKVPAATKKQLEWCSKVLKVDENAAGKLNKYQASELLDYFFNNNQVYDYDERKEVWEYYRELTVNKTA